MSEKDILSTSPGWIKVFIDSIKWVNDEVKNLLGHGLTEYLYHQRNKYELTNTFLHRDERVNFYDIYYPIKVKYKNLTTDFSQLIDHFEEYRYITIIGNAGTGKTTLMRNIFLKSISTKFKIPILIELRYLNGYNGTIENLIHDKVLKSQIKTNNDILNRALNSGAFILLFDGYDELSNDTNQIKRQIELFVDSYPKNNFVITTRPGSGIENFSGFYDFKVCELSNEDITFFLEKMISDQEKKLRVSQVVFSPENFGYLEFLRNPLLLSMFILTFENHPEIPKKKSAFYRSVFETLYSKHDGITKNSFSRYKKTNLKREDFEDILSVFAYISFTNQKFSFTENYLSDILGKIKLKKQHQYSIEDLIYDLRTSISIIILDGFEYFFPHKSIQEYFAALFISKLSIDEKKKVFLKLNLALISNYYNYSNVFTFFQLYYELDKMIAIEYFFIPHLERIYDDMNHPSDEELIKNYILKYDLDLHKASSNGIPSISYGYNSTFDVSFLMFHGIYMSFPTIYDNRALYLLELFNKYKKDSLNIESTLIEELIKEGFAKGLRVMLDHIKNTISTYNDYLNKERSITNDILDL